MKDKLIKALPTIAIVISLFTLVLVFAGFTNFNFKIGDFQVIAGKSDREMFEAVIVRYVIVPDEQRTYLDDKVNQMINIIMNHHVKLLEKHGIKDNYLSCDQYIYYLAIVENALTKMKLDSLERFGFMIKNLRFNSKNKSEFEAFAKNTAVEYINKVSNIISDKWINLGITNEENFEWTRQLIPEIIGMIIDVYNHAFSVQLKYEEQIKILGKL